MNLHPVFAQALRPWAPPGSSVHEDDEQARIAADLARNAAKNSGALLRAEVDRAHAREVAEGVHQ